MIYKNAHGHYRKERNFVHRADSGADPLKLIWMAVLQECVTSLVQRRQLLQEIRRRGLPTMRRRMCSARKGRYVLEACVDDVRWIRSKEFAPGSFLWICEALDLVPDLVLKRLQKLKVSLPRNLAS